MNTPTGNTMVNVTVNVDKDVAVEVITEVLKNPDVVSAVGAEKILETIQKYAKSE